MDFAEEEENQEVLIILYRSLILAYLPHSLLPNLPLPDITLKTPIPTLGSSLLVKRRLSFHAQDPR